MDAPNLPEPDNPAQHAGQAAGSTPGAAQQADRLRLFFALWPDAALRAQLVQHQALWNFAPPARATPAAKLHLTVLFLDGVPAQRLDALRDLGAQVGKGWVDFDLVLDRAAVWQPGGIAHLAPHEVPAALRALHATLAGQAARMGLPLDARRYAPHVTLARRAAALAAPAGFAPLRWRVRDFVLVRSELGAGRYTLLGRWPHDRSPPRV
jgi:2'-5' RNA ligase